MQGKRVRVDEKERNNKMRRSAIHQRESVSKKIYEDTEIELT